MMLAMRRHPLVLILLAALDPLAAQADAPPFAAGPLAEVRAAAKAKGQPLVIDFSHDAVEPCRRLLQTTWRDEELWQWMAKNAIAARIDPEQDAAAAKEFALVAYPTIVMLGKDGAEVGRIVGYVDAAALREQLVKLVHVHPTAHKERTKLADDLAKNGDLDGALEHYLWLWDHGEEHNPAFSGVRASFFVKRMAAFAKKHPPAKKALEERRDALAQRLLAGEIEYQLVADLVALAKALETPAMLRPVLEQIPGAKWGRQAVAKRVLTEAVVGSLVKDRKYADALRLCGDPLELLAAGTKHFGDGPMADKLRKEMASIIVGNQGALLEACFGVRDERAAAFVTRLFELDGSTKTWLMVLNAAKRADNDVACHDYAVRALQELPESEHDEIRKFLEKK